MKGLKVLMLTNFFYPRTIEGVFCKTKSSMKVGNSLGGFVIIFKEANMHWAIPIMLNARIHNQE